MKQFISPLLLGAALLVSINTAAHAEPGHQGRSADQLKPQGMMQVQRIMARIERMAETLDVTEQQLDQMYALVDAQRATVRSLFREARQQRKTLRQTTDPDEVAVLAEQIGDQTAELIVIAHQVRTDLLSVLTEQQRAQLESLRGERRNRFKSRRG